VNDRRTLLENPYRPGAGHTPPYLAGREHERDYFNRLLSQDFASDNILITGLRGLGKTVLLADLRRAAEAAGWIWIGNDLSESASLSEERLAVRILADISEALSNVLSQMNGARSEDVDSAYAYETLKGMYERAPGLPSDRLKYVVVRLCSLVKRSKARGLVFAYDEAQCLSDHAERNEYPMSTLIETIASIQKKDGVAPCILVLCGLPHVFDALTETRTYTERMFYVMQLERLSKADTFEAITRPLQSLMPPLIASPELIEKTVELTGGYPYLIQFFGKELVDQLMMNGGLVDAEDFPTPHVIDRLDAGLFSARWNKTTDKQREALKLIASRPENTIREFSAQDLIALSLETNELSSAQANNLLLTLADKGILYRTRHGHYAFTVPMSETMILRRLAVDNNSDDSWDAPRVIHNGAPRWMTGASPTDVPPPPLPDDVTRSRRWFRS
jgi:hypothetical protein